MKKSVLAIALAVLMAVSLLTVGAMADGTACDGGPDCTHVAAIGDTHYDSLQAAVEDVITSDPVTITLLKEASGNGVVVPQGKNITFDLNGYTYNIDGTTVGSDGTETNGFQLLKGSTIKFKDGTITSEKAKILIQNYSNLTLENVTLNGAKLNDAAPYTLSNNCGNVVISDSTIIAKNGGCAFDIYYWPKNGYVEGVSVTVEGDSVITGRIEYGSDGSQNDVADKAALSITGGTFTGELKLGTLGNGNVANITVSGGTFAASNGSVWDMSSYVQPGMTQDKTGNIVIDTDTAVASRGSVGYNTLSAALAAAKNGETVKLLANVDEDITVAAGQNIILDLNGFKITNVGSSNTITIALGATLEIVGNGTVDNTEHGKAAIWNDGTVTLSGGNYIRSKENSLDANNNGGNSYYTILNHGTMTVNSGVTVENKGKYSSMFENGWQNGNQNKSGKDSVLTINGGTFVGGLNTIKNDDYGILVINDGTFENAIQSTVMNWNKTTINGGEFTVIGASGNAVVNTYADDSMDMGSLTINGGSFSCAGPLVGIGSGFSKGGTISITNGKFDFTGDLLVSASNADVAISGGDFSVSVSDYVAEGFEYEVESSTGRFSYFKTYEEALKAADNGATISKISEDGSLSTNYGVTIVYGNGMDKYTISVPAGTEYTLPTPTNSGYIFLGWRDNNNVTHKAGDVVTVNSDMTFVAVWGNLPDVKPSEPDTPETPVFPFYDVTARDWYYSAVKYVYEKGLMDGVDVGVFAPNDTLTRAMVWTIIARAEGVDTTGGATWYAKAQEWVTAKGISDGENPNAAITRQELVTMLYRLAGEPAVSGNITAPDASSVSTWAQSAMTWAMNIGLVEGDENGAVTPTATATRAQAAALIMRYLEA